MQKNTERSSYTKKKNKAFEIESIIFNSLFKDKNKNLQVQLKKSIVKAYLWLNNMEEFDRLYQNYKHLKDPVAVAQSLLELMEISFTISKDAISRIPESGPLVVVSNHPFGGVEALMICSLISHVRRDIKFLGNHFLSQLPVIRDIIIPVSPFSEKNKIGINLVGVLQAKRWLKRGGILCVFPAGEVSSYNIMKRRVIDPPWHKGVLRFILKSEAKTLPMRFFGYNSPIFHALGFVHPVFRTLRLPGEFLKLKGQNIELCIGETIKPSTFHALGSEELRLWYLRKSTYSLAGKQRSADKSIMQFKPGLGIKKIQSPKAIAPSVPVETLIEEINHLSQEYLLQETNEFQVFTAKSNQIPNILNEIGRLREVTFRMEHEGSNQSRDLDIYDNFYEHIFLWNKVKHEIAGGYRIGRVDQLLNKDKGVKNLYSATLFKFQTDFFNLLPNSLELGRSFVVHKYQKDYLPLLLLWKGIGEYVLRYGNYRYLFGPVSISQAYERCSVQGMIKHLEFNFMQSALAKKVKGKKKPKFFLSKLEKNILKKMVSLETNILDKIIACLESGDKGLPILLKQYLKLGGRIAAFHHDRKFGTFDGLIVVDLVKTNPKVLSRFLGKQGAESYLRFYKEYLSKTNVV